MKVNNRIVSRIDFLYIDHSRLVSDVLFICTQCSVVIQQYDIIQLLSSYEEVNIENCFPEGFSLRENNLERVDNLMFTSYEGNNCFIPGL